MSLTTHRSVGRSLRPAVVDFAAEGLLDGVEGPARDARENLLRELLADGCPLDDLRRAVAEDRLALLPVERLLASEERYSVEDLARLSGGDTEELRSGLAAMGLATDGGRYGEAELELSHLHRVGRNAGFSQEAIEELNRVIGRAVTQIAAVARSVTIEAGLEPGTTEREAALRWARFARDLGPNLVRVIDLAYQAHLSRLVRAEYVGAAEIVAGRTPGARQVVVAFADLVGYTKLGQALPAEELGRVARRLEELASRVARPPVRLVKTVGDAAMLVSPQAAPLVDALLDLASAVEVEGPGFPQVRAGVAAGVALERAGDWYGDPVNVASRVTGAAPPGGVVATEAVREQAPDAFEWTPAGSPALKGVERPPALFRAGRRALA